MDETSRIITGHRSYLIIFIYIYMALHPILWLARWATTPVLMPVFLITSIAFMIPSWYKTVGGLWVHHSEYDSLNSWWRYIPFISYVLVILGWLVNILGHIIADLIGFETYEDAEKTGGTLSGGNPRTWGFRSV